MQTKKVLLAALLGAMVSFGAEAGETAADAVEVLDAYVREVPPVSTTSAAFMTLRNTGTEDHAVVTARSPAAEIVELHTHIMGDDGMHRMREVEKVEIPAGGETVLQPGGLHVMLINLAAPLKAGETVELTLVYDDGSEETLAAGVKTVESTLMMHQGGHAGHDMGHKNH